MAGAQDDTTEVFRSRDPIERFRLRVTLQEVTAGPAVNVDVDGDGVGDGDPSAAIAPTVAETQTIAWQQKIFTAAELDRYRDIANCTTELEKRYHHEAVKQEARQTKKSRLYTYIDDDDYGSLHEERQPSTVGGVCSRSVLAEKMATLRQRKGYRPTGVAVPPHPHRSDVVISTPSERDRARRLVDTPFQVMYVVADLSPPQAGAAVRESQHVLCTIKVDATGVLVVSPTFNGPRPRYRINEGGTVWEYELSHASLPITKKEEAGEVLMLQEMYQRHAEFLSNRIGGQFRTVPDPQAHDTVLHIYGEVVSAHTFEYNNLYVRLEVDLPSMWLCDESSSKAFVTQVSRVTSRGDADDTAMFSYPFELTIRKRGEAAGSDPAEDPSAMAAVTKTAVGPAIIPKLLVQVSSLDFFERHRPEGYGYVPVPTTAGKHDVRVETWRPVGHHVVGRMRRFFLGGAPELQDVTYTAIPHDHHDAVMNRQGFRTEASGSVRVRMHVVRQTHPDSAGAAERVAAAAAARLRKPQHAKLMGISNATLDVLAQFNRAHAKMRESHA
mmetsp:Transcript_10138/g.25998  ORF Transcript_10138/g.25998 Transcript_10138/m.25998 type:complete len:554 (-) Transcript_10138:156-1817(-)